jgi:hypothetical protein
MKKDCFIMDDFSLLIQVTGAILQEGEWLFLIEVKEQYSRRRGFIMRGLIFIP